MSTADDALVWGADVGGTSTRVAAADRTGRVLAVAVDGPGNPTTVGLEASAARVRQTVRRCLDAADPARQRPVRAAVIGLAGVSTVDPDHYARLVDPDRTVRPDVLADLAVAYASGSPLPHGVVALAGTGAGAMEITAGRVTGRHDAWGWLLGDDGSAQWIGREAVRHTLAALEHEAPDALARAILDQLALGAPGDGSTEPVHALLRRVYLDPPTRLAALAPAVSGCDDPAATAILTRAADLVAGRTLGVLGGRIDLPVVLAGSLAAAGGPLHDRLRRRLEAHVAVVTSATDGLAGACWLALGRVGVNEVTVHRELLGSLVGIRCDRTAAAD